MARSWRKGCVRGTEELARGGEVCTGNREPPRSWREEEGGVYRLQRSEGLWHKLDITEAVDRASDDPGSSSASLHGGHHTPAVGARAVHLRRVQVGLPVVPANGKEVPSQGCHAHSSSADVHRLHKLPGVVLRVVPGGVGGVPFVSCTTLSNTL